MKKIILFIMILCLIIPSVNAGYGYAIYGTHWVEGGGNAHFSDAVFLPYIGNEYYNSFLQDNYNDILCKKNPNDDNLNEFNKHSFGSSWYYNGYKTYTTPIDAKGGANLFYDPLGNNVWGRLYGNSSGNVLYITNSGNIQAFSDLFPQENGQISATAFTIGSGIHAGKYIMIANSQGEIKVYKRTATGVERCPQFEFGLESVTGNGLLTIATVSESDGMCILIIEKEDGTKYLYHLVNTVYNLNAHFIYENNVIVNTDINGYNINLETSSIGLEVPYSYNNKINNININVENLSKVELIQFSVNNDFDGMDLIFTNIDENKIYNIYENDVLTFTSKGNETFFNHTTSDITNNELLNIRIVSEEQNSSSNNDNDNDDNDDSNNGGGGGGNGGGGGGYRPPINDDKTINDNKTDDIIINDINLSIIDQIDTKLNNITDTLIEDLKPIIDFEDIFGNNKENAHNFIKYSILFILIIIIILSFKYYKDYK